MKQRMSRVSEEEILKKVRRMEIATRRSVDTLLAGQYHTRFKGQGMQFADFREYYPGDDIRHIDWKVTARSSTAHIRKFEEERDLTIYLLVDVSASGEFGSSTKMKSEIVAETCALIAFSAIRNNDRVGLILFSDKVEKHIPPKKGRSHGLRLIREILFYEPESRKTNIGVGLEFYAKVMKHTAVCIVVSDFYDKNYDKPLRRVAKKHDLVAFRVRDRREVQVPNIGWIEFFDAETGKTFWTDTGTFAFQKKFKDAREAFDREFATAMSTSGAESLDLWTDEDCFGKVVQYFTKRTRGRK